ncbi:MAG: 3-phosphoshikimate 1-carboxyvinyltransferase [Eubacteriales bacterium]|nr:3-phosphoshikimate 1-carboxyvinyltransferase [Eubacteriales bacterium]MDD3289997.1 3-phosphoshikimate 1-carboxyvinyltransferase [Eubacteriales bacterium]MDD4444493.1 3-phosphoshikimate 1-carboxyvinyltransferase [Eubacteriales bacterium]
MNILIQPSILNGRIHSIPSKSQAHRAMICAALSGNPELISIEKPSEDLIATRQALEILRGAGAADCRESGTTLRLLVPIAAALGLDVTFTGEGRLPRRPMEPLLSLLTQHGTRFSRPALPFRLSGRLQSGRYEIPGNISSQYISGLLLALPLLEGDSELILTTDLESGAYVDMTLDCQTRFGIRILPEAKGWSIPGGQAYRAPAFFTVEGDWSNGAFWLAASALGSSIDVLGLSNESLQADRRIRTILDSGETDTDVREIPDLVPILAVLACGKKESTVLRNCGRLRLKESDRIESVKAMIQALGGRIRNDDDDLIIDGTGSLDGGTVNSFQDHRIVMAAAIAATVSRGPVMIRDAQAVSKSYPEFFTDYNALGGNAHVI